ncbi:hypothetical protein DB313_05765 (plasmid) [Borrelia turcica IST7]|uniref:DUF1463 domain-containing protein n=1 Tax=Borrelia turcica IST7 TaxID=1104446 RepID=A0A386PNE5_9SPIR|nr:DUF1463 family protein [Borrelia turcica]AYE37006.1 hypothetical protein DB313_05765 [Borrelia turcica IST7]
MAYDGHTSFQNFKDSVFIFNEHEFKHGRIKISKGKNEIAKTSNLGDMAFFLKQEANFYIIELEVSKNSYDYKKLMAFYHAQENGDQRPEDNYKPLTFLDKEGGVKITTEHAFFTSYNELSYNPEEPAEVTFTLNAIKCTTEFIDK